MKPASRVSSRTSLLAAAVALAISGAANAQQTATIHFSGDIEIPGDPVENNLLGVNETHTIEVNGEDVEVPGTRYDGFVSISVSEFNSIATDQSNWAFGDTSLFIGRDVASSLDFGFSIGDNISLTLADIPVATELDSQRGSPEVSPFALPGDVWPALIFFRSQDDADNDVPFEFEHLAGIGFQTQLSDPIPVEIDGTPLTVEMTVPIPVRSPAPGNPFVLTSSLQGSVSEVSFADLDPDTPGNDRLVRGDDNVLIDVLSPVVDEVVVENVPIPAALPLMASALALFSVVARRRREG